MTTARKGLGARHLVAIASEARPAGSVTEARARRYAADVLRAAGFAVRIHPFSYSAFPGRYATPIGGAFAAIVVCVAAWLAGRPNAVGALAVMAVGILTLALFASSMMGDAVLRLPLLRAKSENLIATRGTAAPKVWLVAHLDSKSQPVPSLVRMGGVVLLAASLLLALAASLLRLLQLAPATDRMAWWAAVVGALLGALPVMASVVGTRSAGALDNASGVAAVLAAAAAVPAGVSFGVLLPSAEEVGLAGARAWARKLPAATALNCDGVDDEGELTIMYNGHRPDALVKTLQRAAPIGARARRMPFGLLTDSTALTRLGWTTVTVSRGSLASLRRVHTPADSLAEIEGHGIADVATLLARAVEALA